MESVVSLESLNNRWFQIPWLLDLSCSCFFYFITGIFITIFIIFTAGSRLPQFYHHRISKILGTSCNVSNVLRESWRLLQRGHFDIFHQSLPYTVFRVKWFTYLPGSPKLTKQSNPNNAVFRITGGKILAGSQACEMENLFWIPKCYKIVNFLGLTQRPT